jgi:Ca2+-binding EF-hand superfamily protein
MKLNCYYRLFRIMDDDGSKNLNFEEFKKGLIEYGLGLSSDDIANIFKEFDNDGSGQINYQEFLMKLRVKISVK